MNIQQISQKIKSTGRGRGVDALIAVGIILAMGIIAFCLGRLSVTPENSNSSQVQIIVPNQNLIK